MGNNTPHPPPPWPYLFDLDRLFRQPLTLPPSLCRDFALRGRLVTVNGVLDHRQAPAAQYHQAEGYVFLWGQLLERRLGNQVRWEFHLEDLLCQYHHAGLTLMHLQQAAFSELERLLPDKTGSEPALFAGWHLLPGSPVSAFCVNGHFSLETETREWLSTTFLPLLLPGLLGKLHHVLGSNRR